MFALKLADAIKSQAFSTTSFSSLALYYRKFNKEKGQKLHRKVEQVAT